MARKREEGVYLRGKIWWIKYYRESKPFYESSDSARREDAVKLRKKRLGEIATGQFKGLAPERINLNELFDAVVEDYEVNGKHTLADVKQRLQDHLRPAFGSIRAAEFGTRHLRRYIADRQKAAAKNATINRELAIVRRAFSLAVKHDPPRVNHVPHIPKLDENNVRTGFLELPQYESLRAELPEYLKPVLVVAYHTGVRLGELMSLQWRQIDLTAKKILLYTGTTKNKKGRTLPIYGDMLPWLTAHKQDRDERFPECPWVFHDGSGKKLSTFYKAWRAACERAGLSGQLIHDLRRSAVRNMVRAGIPETVARQISGHKTRHVFERYDIVSEADVDLAAGMMDSYMEVQRKKAEEAAKAQEEQAEAVPAVAGE